MPFAVLFVCTGNVSRSPMAELMLRAAAGPGSGLVVSSAGVQALVGQPMDQASASAMGQLGFDPAQHRARQFEPAMAAAADLILTAERHHLETLLHQVPTALRRTFTIKEFARIAPHLRPGTPQQVVAQAAAVRGLVPRSDDPTIDDVADPHGRSIRVNRETAAELSEAVQAIVAALGIARGRAAAGGSAVSNPRPRPKPYRR